MMVTQKGSRLSVQPVTRPEYKTLSFASGARRREASGRAPRQLTSVPTNSVR